VEVVAWRLAVVMQASHSWWKENVPGDRSNGRTGRKKGTKNGENGRREEKRREGKGREE
jgi:hypothetical protein